MRGFISPSVIRDILSAFATVPFVLSNSVLVVTALGFS